MKRKNLPRERLQIRQNSETRSPAYGHTNRFAPLADAVVAEAVDGAVGPFHWSGGEGLVVGVAGCGVDGEEHEALAAVDFEFNLVEEIGEAAPVPADLDMGAADGGADVGLNRGVVGPGLLRAFDAESFTHRDVVAGVGLDLFDEGAKPRLDPRRDGRHSGREDGRHRRSAGRQVPAVASEVFPRSPLAGTAQHDLLALERVAVVIGVRCLGGEDGWRETEGRSVGRDSILEGLELGAEAFVGGVNGTGFGHRF